MLATLLQWLLTVNALTAGGYASQWVWRCEYKSHEELTNLLSLANADEHVDLWTEHPDPDAGSLLLRVDSAGKRLLPPTCKEVFSVADLVRVERVQKSASTDYHSAYHSYEEMLARLQTLTAGRIESFGASYEGRPLVAIHFGREDRPLIWIQAGIHAREWIAPSSAMYLAEWLSLNAEGVAKRILDHYHVAICPQVNPDGYEFSRRLDRMWRKNRRPNGDGSYGTDLNRNFANRWGQIGARNRRPSSITYPGPHAASEPEIQAIQAYISSVDPKLRLVAFDLHSAGMLVLRNYGWTMADSPVERPEADLGQRITDAIAKRTGASYQSRKSASLYACTGTSEDYFLEQQGMWGFCVELRGHSGTFVLPPSEIKGTGQDAVALLAATADYFLASPRLE